MTYSNLPKARVYLEENKLYKYLYDYIENERRIALQLDIEGEVEARADNRKRIYEQFYRYVESYYRSHSTYTYTIYVTVQEMVSILALYTQEQIKQGETGRLYAIHHRYSYKQEERAYELKEIDISECIAITQEEITGEEERSYQQYIEELTQDLKDDMLNNLYREPEDVYNYITQLLQDIQENGYKTPLEQDRIMESYTRAYNYERKPVEVAEEVKLRKHFQVSKLRKEI